MIELEILPWLLSLLLTIFTIIFYIGNTGKKPLFDSNFHRINLGNDWGWTFGLFVLYPIYTSLITWIIKTIDRPGAIWQSGSILYYVVVFLGCIFLIIPYFFELNWFKIIEIPVTILCFFTFPLFSWFETGSIPSAMMSMFVLLVVILIFKIVSIIFYFIPKIRDSLFPLKLELFTGIKEVITSKKAIKIVLLVDILFTFLTIANVIIF